MVKNDVAHGLTVSLPNRDRLTMRTKPLKTHDLILSLSKDEAKISCFFSSLQAPCFIVLADMNDAGQGFQRRKLPSIQ